MSKQKNDAGQAKENSNIRYSVNFTPSENARFATMLELSGVSSRSKFIKARVFDESFRVVKVDKSTDDYYQKLTTLYGQFRGVAINYNQVVATLKSNFSEKKALAMLYKLEKLTIELAVIGGEIVHLTNEYKSKW